MDKPIQAFLNTSGDMDVAHALAHQLKNNLPAAPEVVKRLPKNTRQGLILSGIGLGIITAGVVMKQVMDDFKETKPVSWLPLIPADVFGLQLMLKASAAFNAHHLPPVPKSSTLFKHLNTYGHAIPPLREALDHISHTLNQTEGSLSKEASHALQERLGLLKHYMGFIQKHALKDDASRLNISPQDLYRQLGLHAEWKAKEEAKPKRSFFQKLMNGEVMWINGWLFDAIGKRPFHQDKATTRDVQHAFEAVWENRLATSKPLQKAHNKLLGEEVTGHPLGFGYTSLFPNTPASRLWTVSLA